MTDKPKTGEDQLPEPDAQQTLDQAREKAIELPLPHEVGDENAQPG